ncbi:MAG: hypothetical protein N4J56_005671 [Chroococcidiopsis sp. SAG 2025]|uniref:precorrin-8X methylmutase n=1 Tax=Chroococcidiopsis sp. SAG 2025 TaxID=171389 RepID=UPI002936F0A9|nr:precorrin-8X methylmutase [Chroococcidiopsis sp. SAG 2025]MDV2996017.1 hypothetical protein [Chroococcidiopsis sp. SAG 2025]
MTAARLTIKELTEAVGGNCTPRMVRHYHQLGILPPPERSHSNYRLYTQENVQQLRRIVALKQQGFQLSHIRELLKSDAATEVKNLTHQLQQQYHSVMQQMARLRQTATALEGLLGRDRSCQNLQAEAIAQLRLLEVESQDGLGQLEQLWENWDAATHAHPEEFQESLQQLLPDLSNRSEIEIDLLSKLVLACGDVSLVNFIRVGKGAIAAARHALTQSCEIVGDVTPVVAACDRTRLSHLGCTVTTLIADPHVSSVVEAEQAFWHQNQWQEQLQKLPPGCIFVVGYAPSVLIAACDAIAKGHFQPALIIGMPIGFSHAPSAKRRLMRSGIPYITIEGTMGGGLLAAVALNALVESTIEKPDCHCYLGESVGAG